MRKALRNKWKRVCSLVLAAAMAVTMFPAANAQADTPEKETVELVQNRDFETGNDGWIGYSGGKIENVVTTEDGRVNHILRVKERENTSSSAMYNLSGKLTKGTTYHITGRIKYVTGPDTKDFNVMFQNVPDGVTQNTHEYRPCVGTVTAQKGKWARINFYYEAKDHYLWGNPENLRPFGTKENYFFIETEWKSSTIKEEDLMDYYLDDISITYEGIKGERPEPGDLISNGTFENEVIDRNWKTQASEGHNVRIERVQDVVHGGTHSLKVTGCKDGWDAAQYDLGELRNAGEMVAGKSYTLTFWAKTDGESGDLEATITGTIGGKGSWISFGKTTGKGVNKDGWTKVSQEITLENYDAGKPLFIYIHWLDDHQGTFYIDDVSLMTLLEQKVLLSQRIDAAKAMLSSLSETKKAALNTAIGAAEAVYNKENASNPEYWAARNALNAAITEAQKPDETPGGDKTAKEQLGEKIKEAKGMLASLSETKKAALNTAIGAAEAVYNNADATEQQLQAALTALSTAITEAQKPDVTPGDSKTLKQQLGEKIQEAKNMLDSLSETKKAALNTAIGAAETVYNNASATEQQLQAALADLNTAITEAKKPDETPGGDKTAKEQLDEKIKEAKGMLSSLSDAKKAALNTAIGAAETVYNNASATEQQLQAALADLNTAITEAKKPDETPGGDKTAKEQLDEKIKEAKGMLSSLSDAKKAALNTAIGAAETVYNNASATEQQLQAALADLNTAITEAKKPDETPGGDKTAKEQLDEKIKAAKDMLAGLSADKKAALQAVITEVEGVLGKEDASDAEITAALNKLNKAIEDAGKTDEKPALNQTFTETSGLIYKVTDYSGNVKNVTVTGADKQLSDITVPDTVVYRNETFMVTAIADSAFANQASLTSVTIGKNVTTIGAKAFMNAKKLKKITFQGTAVKTVGKDAFKGIDKKAAFTMSKSFTDKNLKYKITKCTVSACEVAVTGSTSKKLTSVNVPATVKFNGMSFKVTSVGKKAFRKQAKLKSATIGKNVKKIEASAFEGCKNLAKVKFSGTAIKSIGKNAFKGVKKNVKFSVKKSKKAYYKKLLKKAKTKNFKI